ncbi:MAG: ChaB family protein [Candidatus Omnitrophota bacterium]
MPYSSRKDLPANLQDILPQHAQEIFRKAFNSAYDEYSSSDKRKDSSGREATARKVAWNAVKSQYKKGDDGKWHKKQPSRTL